MNLKNRINKLKGFVLLKNGQIYDPYIQLNKVGDILIKDGIIKKIAKKISSSSNYKHIDCSDSIITNGFVDLHSHFREPGFEYKETLESGSFSAFYGGYTRVCIMPNTNPVIDNPELVKFIFDKSKDMPIHIYPIGAITKGQKGYALSEIGEMVSEGIVAISDDGIPVSNSQVLRSALEYSKKFNIPVINHAEDMCLVNKGLMNESEKSMKMGLSGNPDIAESTMIFRDLSIANYISGKIHVPHVSSYKSLEIIKLFKKNGLNVSVEVTPHHLCLTEDIIGDYNTNAKVAPPIRSKKDRKKLISAVKSGLIDCIATDHAPHSIDDKEKDFANAMCGMIGLESAFGLVHKTLRKEKMSTKSIINLFTINPSKIIKVFPNTIEEGNNAELNIINPEYKWIFNDDCIQSKSKNTPILGYELLGKVLITINNGFISSCKSKKI